MDKVIDEYTQETTWRIQSNANWNKSFSGLQSHIAGTVLAKDAINKFGKIGKKHNDGAYHLHNLEGGVFSKYCQGNDLLSLLQKGLINIGSVTAKPAKHFSSALDQINNYTYLMTGEFMGAQAWRDIDVLLAPFIFYDNLTYDTVKQEIQQLVWNLSFNLRPGFQSPFTNITFGLRPSKYYKELSPIVGGEYVKSNLYTDFQDEIDLFNTAFLDVLIEGPGDNRPFTFPMPTFNITPDFKWDSEISNKIFELASKWGTPYFANYINTDMTEEDSLSMCCRLKLNLKEIQKVSGGIWNFGSNTGSLAVFTVNLARIGYLSNGKEDKFFKILDNVLEDGREYLLQKKVYISKGMDLGLFPMTKEYVGDKITKTYFLTIGINGLNECSMNFCEQDIIQNVDWCDKVLKYIKDRVLQFQVESGHLFNFESTPGEGCSYSLARLDREKFVEIYTQGDDKVPYYTGSSLIPSNYDIFLPEAIKHQDRLQQNYTGGTVFHIDLGEMAGGKAIKDLIRATCTHTKLPYLTWSPSYSICPIHGKSGGKACCDQAQVYSRVVGYYRPTVKWNAGKRKEFEQKKFYKNAY